MKYKKVTISVNNKELDALEDYLTKDYEGDYKREQKDINKSLCVWEKLCEDFDRPVEDQTTESYNKKRLIDKYEADAKDYSKRAKVTENWSLESELVALNNKCLEFIKDLKEL